MLQLGSRSIFQVSQQHKVKGYPLSTLGDNQNYHARGSTQGGIDRVPNPENQNRAQHLDPPRNPSPVTNLTRIVFITKEDVEVAGKTVTGTFDVLTSLIMVLIDIGAETGLC